MIFNKIYGMVEMDMPRSTVESPIFGKITLRMMNQSFETLRSLRNNFLKLLEGHSLATLNLIPGGFNNNLIWNLGHVLVTQQLLVYVPAGQPMHIEDALIEKYRRGTKPDGKATLTELERLRHLAGTTIDLLEADLAAGILGNYEGFTTGIGVKLTSAEEAIRFVPLHEALHYGYAMALKRMQG